MRWRGLRMFILLGAVVALLGSCLQPPGMGVRGVEVTEDPTLAALQAAIEASDDERVEVLARLFELPESHDLVLSHVVLDESAAVQLRAGALIALARRAGPSVTRRHRVLDLARELIEDDHVCERLALVADVVSLGIVASQDVFLDPVPRSEMVAYEKSVEAAVAPQFGMLTHWKELTLPALVEDLEWSGEEAVNAVVDGNLATDLESLRRDWYGWLVGWLFPEADKYVPDVAILRTEELGEFHFDNLFTWNEVREEWAQLDALVSRELDRLDSVDWAAARRPTMVLLGVVHHAVQDFYSHSNWCHIFGVRLAVSRIPTWEEYADKPDSFAGAREILIRSTEMNVSSDRSKGGLQTGHWGDFKCEYCKCVEPWWV